MTDEEFLAKQGFFKDATGKYYHLSIDGQHEAIFAPINTLEKVLGLSAETIKSRIKDSIPQKARRKGKLIDVYNLNEVKAACADLLAELPLRNEIGLVIIDGQKFTTIGTLAKFFGVSYITIKTRINYLKPQKAKHKGLLIDVYNLNEAKAACANLLVELPLCAETGLVIIDGQGFAALKNLERLLGISCVSIKTRIKSLRPQKARSRNGQLIDVYNLNEVKAACADLLAKLPLCDESGLVIIDGQEFASIATLAKLFSISPKSIKLRVSSVKPQKAKHKGHLLDVYNVNEAKAACVDRLEEIPLCNKTGLVIIDGQEFASIATLAKLFGIGYKSIKTRIKRLIAQKAKAFNGNLIDVYNVNEAKAACVDRLLK